MGSGAATVDEYLAELPGERRDVVEAVRRIVLDHLPEGVEESMNFGMKLDMGKSCVRFKRLDQLLTDALEESLSTRTTGWQADRVGKRVPVTFLYPKSSA